ncbi:MAG: DNA polymerase subunit beta [Methanosphaera sp.]|nr:DNA polymerase subunit beta [Methanosphaera sp.]
MNIQPRYFIKTKDGLFFAVNSYNHPSTHYISFLRYVPCSNGNREINGIKYKKVNSNEAYEYIKENHPDYLFNWNVENKKMMGVPKEDISEIISPIKRLKEIIESDDNNIFYDKIRLLSSIFHNQAGISYEDMGVTGSTIVNLQNNDSDIDFVIFGQSNHRKAIKLYSKLKDDENSPLDKISGDYWKQVYDIRIKDDSMTLEEFQWYEARKNNRGLINGTLFAILLTKHPDEVEKYDEVINKPIGKMKIKCTISDDKDSYDSPATFHVKDVQVLEGNNDVKIDKILSFTHTYTGIVKNDENIIASGVCEEVIRNDSIVGYNLIIGTTRESIDEYIKLEYSPL